MKKTRSKKSRDTVPLSKEPDPDAHHRAADPQQRLQESIYTCLTSFSFSRSVSGPITIPAQQQIILIPKPVQKVQTVIRYASVLK
jgi:hypothetical protein